jgi:arginase
MFGYRPKVAPARTVIVGLRDVDQEEKLKVKQSGVHVFTMRDIDERGLRSVMEEAIRLATEGAAGFHLSLDMDFVDPKDAPGVGTPVRGGATYREAHLAMEMICDSGKMVSMEVVEVNPVIDEVNRTADLGVELVMSGLGKRIL